MFALASGLGAGSWFPVRSWSPVHALYPIVRRVRKERNTSLAGFWLCQNANHPPAGKKQAVPAEKGGMDAPGASMPERHCRRAVAVPDAIGCDDVILSRVPVAGMLGSPSPAERRGFAVLYSASCGPHDYLEPPQPLPPAGFSGCGSSGLASSPSSAFSSTAPFTASTASSTFSSTTSAACSTAFSAPPALGLPPQALPPAAWAAGMVMLPELTSAATPRPARSFFRSLLSITLSSLWKSVNGIGE